MGFLGLGKKQTKPEPAAKPSKGTDRLEPASRKSVRRVVSKSAMPPVAKTEPVSKPASARTEAKPFQKSAAATAATLPMAVPAPSAATEATAILAPSFDDGIDLPAPGTPAAARATTRPITASTLPSFTGNLGNIKTASGPSRAGDAALLEFLTGKAALIDAAKAEQMQAKAKETGTPLDVAGTTLGFYTEEQLVTALTQECWVPHLKVDKYEIRKKALDTVAREDAVHWSVFPVDKLGSLLTLAMVNPLDLEAIRAVEGKTGLDVKKVVATRGEIERAIEKYYSGLTQATDASRSFTQDSEPRSMTQMLSGLPKPPEAAPNPMKMSATFDIAADIQDIDDLLSSEEAVAPTIIEPISLKAEPSSEPVLDDGLDLVETSSIKPVTGPETAMAGSVPNTGALTRQQKPTVKTAEPFVPPAQFELDDTASVAKPAPPKGPARASYPTPEPSSIEPVAPTPAPAFVPATSKGSDTRGPMTSSTARLTGSGEKRTSTTRFTQQAGAVNLLPVTEEEFRHAVSHGKSQAFDKWITLQSRNRIINALPVEADIAKILAPLYANPRR